MLPRTLRMVAGLAAFLKNPGELGLIEPIKASRP
jgi:hypothetical protein